MEKLTEILEFELINLNDYSLTVLRVVLLMAVFLGTKIILFLIKRFLNRDIIRKSSDKGSLLALYQLTAYVCWIISIVVMFEVAGVKITLFLAGSAALLVGVGLGLQQTFNDVLSGVILLFEKSVKVGDILDVDGDVVKVEEIGLRASRALTRRNVSVMLPNSLMTNNKVINWSYQSRKATFAIDIGVAYGSDVELVMNLLKESASEHPAVLKGEPVNCLFMDFAHSALNFRLLFCSEDAFTIGRVKSDIRIVINRKFIENGIQIPFPQMDLHVIPRPAENTAVEKVFNP